MMILSAGSTSAARPPVDPVFCGRKSPAQAARLQVRGTATKYISKASGTDLATIVSLWNKEVQP